MKACILLSILAVCAVAEPPSALSTQYGAPSRTALSTQYGAPSTRGPSAQYGAPAVGGPSSGRSSASIQGPAARVSSSFRTGSSVRLPAGRRIGTPMGSGLSSQYGGPSTFGRAGGFGGNGLSSQYGAPSYSSGAVSTQYGVHSMKSTFGRAENLSPVYGVPGYGSGRANFREDALAEPANYQFSYSVEDASSLSDFGHDEVRQDESAQGEYRVLLPDGRKQIVSYEADEDGYRPNIQYEDTGITAYSAGGYSYGRGRNDAGAGNGGYRY